MCHQFLRLMQISWLSATASVMKINDFFFLKFEFVLFVLSTTECLLATLILMSCGGNKKPTCVYLRLGLKFEL